MINPEFKKHPAYKRTSVHAWRTLDARLLRLRRAIARDTTLGRSLVRLLRYLSRRLEVK